MDRYHLAGNIYALLSISWLVAMILSFKKDLFGTLYNGLCMVFATALSYLFLTKSAYAVTVLYCFLLLMAIVFPFYLIYAFRLMKKPGRPRQES